MEGSDQRTLILLGNTGNGKSATGNSIHGNKTFQSKFSACGVTRTSELKTTVLENGQRLNVIDTPGLFGSSADDGTYGMELARGMKMAVDGLHAVLLVCSFRNLFFDEEKDAVLILQCWFGRRICDHMIVVITCGDDLEEEDKTLEDFICECPKALKEILLLCGNRCVLFDNRTKDQTKKADQVKRLLALVNKVLENNNGEPFFNEIFIIMKKWIKELHGSSKEEEKRHGDRLTLYMEMIELKFMNLKLKFEQDLAQEKNARSIDA